MYGRNKNGKILNILLGVIALFIIIFIIAWIVNKGSNNANYDEIFKANLEKMQETAKNHFANELPEEIGDTTLISLDEMYTLDLSDELKYGNTVCDNTLSYISITKINATEYKVKSNLVCGTKSDSIVEKIQTNTIVEDDDNNVIVDDNKDDVELDVEQKPGSNNGNNNVNCFGPVCTFVEIETTCKTTYEYEYVKRNVSCDTGKYVNGTCITEKTHTIKPTPEYSKEQLIIEAAKENPGKPYYRYVDPIITGGDNYAFCKNGELKNGYCYEYADKITKTEEKCPTGYKQEGNYCYKYTDLIVEEDATCPEGYTPKNNACYKYADLIVEDNRTSKCPNGYTESGNRCVKVVSAVKKYTEWGNPDKIYSTTKEEATYEYELSKKVLVGKNKVGVTTTYTYAIYSRTSYYYCAQGEVNGSKCNIYTDKVTSGQVKEYCPSGYDRSGNTCYIKKDMIYSEDSYCPTGYTRLGSSNICYDKEDLIIIIDHYCPTGYTESESYCYKKSNPSIGTTPKKYSCPKDANQSGSGKDIKCYYIEISDNEYYCERAEATLKGDKCYYTKKAELIGYTCKSGYELVGDLCIKTTKEYSNPTWSNSEYIYSKETYLEGYQKTGVAKYVTKCTPVEEIHYK